MMGYYHILYQMNTIQDFVTYLQANPIMAVLLVIALYYLYTYYINSIEGMMTKGQGMKEYGIAWGKQNKMAWGANRVNL